MDAIVARASERGLDHFRPSSAPPELVPKKSDAKPVEPTGDLFEPARARIRAKLDPLAEHLQAPMARDMVSLRKPQGHPVVARLDAMLKKHPGTAERAFLAEAILADVADPTERYRLTEQFLRQHPEAIPLFFLNALARPTEKWLGEVQQDLVGLWQEIRVEWRRLTRP